MMIVHAHIGALDLFPTLLDKTVVKFGEQIITDESLILSKSDFKFASSKKKSIHEVIEMKGPQKRERVIMSIHKMLGPVWRDNTLYPNAGFCLHLLNSFLNGSPLCVHLIVTPQYGYKHIPGNGPEASWVALVNKVRKVFPNASIVVWPFELPCKKAGKYIEAMVGKELTHKQHMYVDKLTQKQRFGIDQSNADDFSNTDAIYLDSLYERDLKHLQSLENVYVQL